MEQELTSMLTVQSMWAITQMIKEMVGESSPGKMESDMRENGMKACRMAMVWFPKPDKKKENTESMFRIR